MDSSKLSEKSDSELVLLTIANQEYYSFLIKRYEDKLARYVHRISNYSDEDIEDILQEVFIKAYKNIYDFDHKLKFSSWIYRITHNEVISKHRKIQARPKSTISLDDEYFREKFADDTDVGGELDKKFLKVSVAEVLQKLDTKYREVLVLKYLEDKSYEEISDILKKPVGTVGTLLRRAREKFRELL